MFIVDTSVGDSREAAEDAQPDERVEPAHAG